MPEDPLAIVVSVAIASVAANGYFTSAIGKVAESLNGQAVLLGEAVQNRLVLVHRRFRERIGAFPASKAKTKSVKDLQAQQDAEDREWTGIVEDIWSVISQKLRHVHAAQRANHTICAMAKRLAHINIALSVIPSLALAIGHFWQIASAYVATALPWILALIIVSTLVVWYCLQWAETCNTKVQRIIDDDDWRN
jgi:hypothetical protein